MRFLATLLLILFTTSLKSQDYRREIYASFVTGEMDHWKAVMDRMESAWKRNRDPELLYKLTEAQYGYTGYCISMKNKKEARFYIEKAEQNIDLLLKTGRNKAAVYALQGALFGFRVGMEPLKAPVYGKKSQECNDLARQIAPDHPQVVMEQANIEFYKPALFGGSKERAVPLYEKAVALFESNSEEVSENWMYLNCMAALANAYVETGDPEKAGRMYRKILKTEPEFEWIRDEVYPEFKKKHQGI